MYEIIQEGTYVMQINMYQNVLARDIIDVRHEVILLLRAIIGRPISPRSVRLSMDSDSFIFYKKYSYIVKEKVSMLTFLQPLYFLMEALQFVNDFN